MEIEAFTYQESSLASGTQDSNLSSSMCSISVQHSHNHDGDDYEQVCTKSSLAATFQSPRNNEPTATPGATSSGTVAISTPPDITKVIAKTRKTRSRKCVGKPFKYEVILKNSSNAEGGQITRNMLQLQRQKQQRIERILPVNKVFFIAGDILVEIDGQSNPYSSHSPVFNEFRNMVSIEQRNATVSIEIESIAPMKKMTQVIELLEKSQNAYNYEFAQIIKIHEMTMGMLQHMIEYIIQATPEKQLSVLIAARKKYRDALLAAELTRLSNQDEFCIVGNVSLSFVNQTITISKVGFTNALIAAAGANPNELQALFMRKGFLNSINFVTQRILFARMMNQQVPGKRTQAVEIPNFEFLTLDGIKIICTCVAETKSIAFPSDLEFKGIEMSPMNHVETMFVLRLEFKQNHIENVLRIRSENITTMQENKAMAMPPRGNNVKGYSEIKEQMEIISLEYAVISTEFLKKFYKNKADIKVEGKRICRIGDLAQRIHQYS